MGNPLQHNMRRIVVCGFAPVIVLAFCFADSVSAQRPGQWTPPPEEEVMLDDVFETSVSDEFVEEISGVIANLGVPSFKKREEATRRLIDLGPQAFLILRDAYFAVDELEVRLRIEHIFREGYLQHYVFGRNAFLGIQQRRNPETNVTDSRIEEGFVGIVIGKIIEGTAAEAAGLKKDDVLIEVDGEPIPDRSSQSNLSFGESIRVRGPGVRVTLTVLRGNSELAQDVVLRSRPREFYRRQGVVSQMLGFYARTFDVVWERHIQAPSSSSMTDESSYPQPRQDMR